MRHATQSKPSASSDTLYFLSAFVMAVLFAITLGNLEPNNATTGYLKPVKVQIAASVKDRSGTTFRFDDGG